MQSSVTLRIKQLITKYAPVWLGLVLGFLLLLNLLYKWSLISGYAPDLGGFERNVIWGIQQIMCGKPLYSDPQAAPFAIVQYMPFYYYVVAWMGNLFSINALEAHSVYFLARGINGLFCVLSAFFIFTMARKIFQVDFLIAFGVSVLAFLLMDKFAISGRPDSLKAFLFQLIVFTLLQFPEKRKRFVLPIAVILGALAFFTKQDGLVFCGILPLTLFIKRSWKELILWSVVTGIVIATFVAVFHAIHPDFLKNVAGGLQNGISISWFVSAFGGYLSLMALLFGLAMVLCFEFLFEDNWKLNVLASAFICSFFPQILFALKYGSAPNYFLECTLISCLFLAIWLQQKPLAKAFVFPAAPLLLAIIALKIYFYIPSINWITAVFFNQENRLKSQYEAQKSVAGYIRNTSSSGNPTVLVCIKKQWEDHLTTLLANESIAPTRDVIVQVADAKGKLDFSGLKERIESGSVDFLVTEKGNQPDFLGLNYNRYQLEKDESGYTIWSPVSDKAP